MIRRAPIGRSVTAACVAACVAAGPALAQEDGVTVDPNSPAQKEYAIPIDRARKDADPTRRADDSGKPESPRLFGAGIGSRSRSESESGGRTASSGGSTVRGAASSRSTGEGGAAGDRDGSASALPDSDEVSRLATAGADGAGAGQSLLIAGGGALVLLGGATGGFLLRRRSRVDG